MRSEVSLPLGVLLDARDERNGAAQLLTCGVLPDRKSAEVERDRHGARGSCARLAHDLRDREFQDVLGAGGLELRDQDVDRRLVGDGRDFEVVEPYSVETVGCFIAGRQR